jgi:vancomycin resistance protein YoaR
MHALRTLIATLRGAALCPAIVAAMAFGIGADAAIAAPTALTFTYKHHIFTVYPAKHPEWKQPRKQWFYQGMPAVPPARLLTCGTEPIDAPGWTNEVVVDWNTDAIQRTLEREIGSKFNRDPGSVVIAKSASGTIVFDGKGLPGRKVDVVRGAALVHAAMEQNISTVVLPVIETPAGVRVEDEELRQQGIREVVTVGESVFAGSPKNRRHNIAVGVAKFNGHLIPQGSVFSFVETLGPVNAATGYVKELVIQGAQTLPDYGGGLCQVSSTAYRGPWEYGMPIVQRKNHSYAVTYYSPQGTDATIYPPSVDMKFLNDTPGALLMQSFTDDEDRAFFIYYGTKDSRKSEVFGPFISDRVSAPKDERVEYSTDRNKVQVGEKKKVGDRHDGMKVMWYRSLQPEQATGATLESFFSLYETRQLYYLIGVESGDNRLATGGDLSDEPSWLPSR